VLFAIGSPHARKGETYNTYNKHFGASGNPAILVANGPTTLFDPTIKRSVIDRAYEEDAAVAASEWGGQFRNDLESYVNPEIVDACMLRGVYRLDFVMLKGYKVTAEVFGASATGVGGVAAQIGADVPSIMAGLLAAHGEEIVSFLAERGIGNKELGR
jgi:hypothetical protein